MESSYSTFDMPTRLQSHSTTSSNQKSPFPGLLPVPSQSQQILLDHTFLTPNPASNCFHPSPSQCLTHRLLLFFVLAWALRALKGLTGHNQPQLGLPHTLCLPKASRFHLSSAQGLQLVVCWFFLAIIPEWSWDLL